MKRSSASGSEAAKPARRRSSKDFQLSLTLSQARRLYAEELRYSTGARSDLVIDAFATVPRERFLGPGPWKLIAGRGPDHATLTPAADHARANAFRRILTLHHGGDARGHRRAGLRVERRAQSAARQSRADPGAVAPHVREHPRRRRRGLGR